MCIQNLASVAVLTSRPLKIGDRIHDLEERVRNLNTDSTEDDCVQVSNAVRQHAKQLSSQRQSPHITKEQLKPVQLRVSSNSNVSLPTSLISVQILLAAPSLEALECLETRQEEGEEEESEEGESEATGSEEASDEDHEEAEQSHFWFSRLPIFLKTGLDITH